jgi:hypothetical protein
LYRTKITQGPKVFEYFGCPPAVSHVLAVDLRLCPPLASASHVQHYASRWLAFFPHIPPLSLAYVFIDVRFGRGKEKKSAIQTVALIVNRLRDVIQPEMGVICDSHRISSEAPVGNEGYDEGKNPCMMASCGSEAVSHRKQLPGAGGLTIS